MYHRIFPISVVFATASLLLIACTDSKINSSDIPEITQSIFVVPESYYGNPYESKRYHPSDEFFVNVNEKIKICGIYSLDGNYISSEESTPYYNTHRWLIDNKDVNASTVYQSFDKAGIHKVTFETVDHIGDTIRTDATIYVNTPSTVSLQTPANNYNQVDGKNENGLELLWNVSGIDPWETSFCTIYASYDKDSVWSAPLGDTYCSEGVNLLGELDLYIDEKGDSINHDMESSTIYWAVEASIKNGRGSVEHAFSEIFSFSTKLHNSENSIIEIPVACQFDQYPEKSSLNGAIISATGDTLFRISNAKANTVIREELQPQSNIKIVVCDSIRTEFGCDSMVVDLAPSTKTTTDTLFLRDKVKPNMVPVETVVQTNSALRFFIFDNGAGVNASKIQAFANNDSLQTKFENHILSIPNTCKKECNLVIRAEDYARNKAPNVYWKIKVNGTETKITGPFSKTEE